MKKIILTDIDGVCLDWSDLFDKYLQKYYPNKSIEDPTEYESYKDLKDIMKEFNNSAWVGFMDPLRDAKYVLNKLSSEGWEVHGCTAMGHDPYAIALRKQNLEMHFPNVFKRLDTVGFDVPKADWLAQYRGHKCVWVEDKWGNAIAGATIGHKTFLMRHEYNASSDHSKVTKVDNWQQIYYYIN